MISVGFILALWSGSRALNVFVDTITIMYGLGGHRGIVKTRVLSFSLYVMGLVTGVVTIPLVVAGPGLVDRVLPDRLDFLNELYWPIVVVLCICFLATLYHVSVPVRTSWRYNLPGRRADHGDLDLRLLPAALGADQHGQGVDVDLRAAVAPIVVMLWLYLLSIAVLIGAAVNAAFDRLWPEKETARARMEIVGRLRMKALMPRLRRDDGGAGAVPRRGRRDRAAAAVRRGGRRRAGGRRPAGATTPQPDNPGATCAAGPPYILKRAGDDRLGAVDGPLGDRVGRPPGARGPGGPRAGLGADRGRAAPGEPRCAGAGGARRGPHRRAVHR